ncbi:hypothetical protein [Pajaroellobacter abortibovis]|uniref:Uncharacterized protein n=1 Tax=Pajaroellobacter abortibovis TaxID=1882918 RepID=A0A1L6MYI3_9BACT|nr:hypothetical protein [Pajaroellobacter abortibovis]APS00614.1 hypothetical protein BCY86_07970 [Pajaroellobacter abortibovis]
MSFLFPQQSLIRINRTGLVYLSIFISTLLLLPGCDEVNALVGASCKPGLIAAGNQCVSPNDPGSPDEHPCGNTKNDPFNCGSCGNVCRSGICIEGQCQDKQPGHVALLGHDYDKASLSPSQVQILINAVNLGKSRTIKKIIKVLGYEAYASTLSLKEIKQLVGFTTSTNYDYLTVEENDIDQEIKDKNPDVVLIYDQTQSPPGELANLGKQWQSALQNFLLHGGVIVVLDGGAGTGEMHLFVTEADLIPIKAKTSLSPNTNFAVIAPGDMLSRDMTRTYSSLNSRSASFTLEKKSHADQLVTVVEEPKAHQSVVIHRVVPPSH